MPSNFSSNDTIFFFSISAIVCIYINNIIYKRDQSINNIVKNAIKQQCGGPTKSTAKIASDFKRPDGLTVIYPDQLQKFLENATNNGKVLRIFNQTGTIEPDKQKDILNLSANRIEDIEYIGRIDAVISNGRIIEKSKYTCYAERS
jgi:hypothetical protein